MQIPQVVIDFHKSMEKFFNGVHEDYLHKTLSNTSMIASDMDAQCTAAGMSFVKFLSSPPRMIFSHEGRKYSVSQDSKGYRINAWGVDKETGKSLGPMSKDDCPKIVQKPSSTPRKTGAYGEWDALTLEEKKKAFLEMDAKERKSMAAGRSAARAKSLKGKGELPPTIKEELGL